MAQMKVRILHFEDDSFDAEIIARELKGLPYQTTVIRAAEEREFETLLGREHFDLIICDSGLPGYDSLKALEAAKVAQPGTPFIFLSGTDSMKLKTQGLSAGAQAFLNKSDLGALVTEIRRLFGDR